MKEIWLANEFLKTETKELQKAFTKNSPFPHLLIKDFLKDTQAKKLQTAIEKESFEKKQSDLFSLSQTQDFATVENKTLKEFYEFFKSKELINIISKITGLKLKSGILDMAGSLYEDTDYLLCHDDQLQGRKIAYIYYLSENFKEKDGGALALLSDKQGHPEKAVKRYLPISNSLIMFQVSKNSWHEVEEILSSKKRHALGGWFY